MTNKPHPILIVEDRAADLDLIKRAFTKQGLIHPIQIARDGEEALAYVDRWEAGEPRPVFILLDLNLPKISGLEVLRKLKNHRTYSIIPVIVLTSSNEERDIQEAYQLGCNSYLVKPVNFNKLIELVHQIEAYWCSLNVLPRN